MSPVCRQAGVDSLRYHVQGISSEAFYESFQRNRRKVVDAGLVKGGGVWIMDATDIEVDGEYAGMGVVREVIETVDKRGRHHKRVEEHKGFKWVTLYYLFPESKWLSVMAYRVLPLGEQHEITVSDALIEEIVGEFGEGFIGDLQIDRGFLDGERIHKWHTEYGIVGQLSVVNNCDVRKTRSPKRVRRFWMDPRLRGQARA